MSQIGLFLSSYTFIHNNMQGNYFNALSNLFSPITFSSIQCNPKRAVWMKFAML